MTPGLRGQNGPLTLVAKKIKVGCPLINIRSQPSCVPLVTSPERVFCTTPLENIGTVRIQRVLPLISLVVL